MAYKMTQIGEKVRIGQRGDGYFDIEVWPEGFGEGEMDSVLLPEDAAQDVAKYLLRKS